MEPFYHTMIDLSIDFGDVSDSSPCTVAAALLRSLQCRVSRKAGFEEHVARAVVLSLAFM